jgi:hypothetical protein
MRTCTSRSLRRSLAANVLALGLAVTGCGPANAMPEPTNSPAVAHIAAAPGTIVINEILAHTDEPDHDFIELHNPGATVVNIGGWLLTDKSDASASHRYPIPAGTTIGPGSYALFTDQSLGFRLSEFGEQVYLYAPGAQGELIEMDRVEFGASPNGQSFGRYRTGSGEIEFPLLEYPTPRTANPEPWVAPIVVAEIMYKPTAVGGEYLIVANRTGVPQPLFDPERPGHRWQIDGVAYTFPPDLVLEPYARLIVAGIAPDEFRAVHHLPAQTPVVGPFNGKLNNDGERLALQEPQPPELDGYVPYVDIDVVEYGIAAPWPSAAADHGTALQRIELDAFGNDATNWRAGVTDLATIGVPPAAHSVFLPAVTR